MRKIQISGYITVNVDEVDIEQIILERPNTLKGMPPAICAIAAASRLDEVRSFRSQIDQHDYELHHAATTRTGKGYRITFAMKKGTICGSTES